MEVNLTINDKPVTVPQGTTILQAAKKLGIRVPTFCYHAQMLPVGACRVCMVEVEKMGKLQIACATPVSEGMKVKTNSPAAVKAQRGVIEFLLLNHPLDCPVCDKGGECELQDLTYRFGPSASRYIFPRYKHERKSLGPLIVRDQNRCIQCRRCVRICREYHGKSCLGTIDRGFYTEIASFNFESTTCDFCGDCIEVCPVGALTSKPFRFKARVWNLSKTETTCPYCADGCRISIESLATEIKRIRPRRVPGEYVSDTHLCMKGYFGFQFINHPDRIKTPLIKKDGQLVSASWDAALTTIANRFAEIKKEHGPDAIAGLGSSRCTNEENYLFQKFMRTVIGTNNIDYLMTDRGSEWNELWFNLIPNNITFTDIEKAKTILIIGADISIQNPVLGLHIKQAVMRNQTRLIELNSAPTDLKRFTTHPLICNAGKELDAANALAKSLILQNLVDFGRLQNEAEDSQEYLKTLNQIAIETLLESSGLDNSILTDAVKTLAQSDKAGDMIILFGRQVIEHPARNRIIAALSNLTVLLNNQTRVLPLFEYTNSRGAVDMGLVPFLYPGYQRTDDNETQTRFGKLWNCSLPIAKGMNATEMFEAALETKLQAMYIIGENPIMRVPDRTVVTKALDTLQFLVVQDMFLTETAQYADVVLPASSFAEKEGTFTNIEGKVQKVTQAIYPLHHTKPDWWILTELAKRMETPWPYRHSSEILEEIITSVPLYKSIEISKLNGQGYNLPIIEPFQFVSATLDLFAKKSKLYTETLNTVPDKDSSEYPLLLATGNLLTHSGSFTRWSEVLHELAPEPHLSIHQSDADRYGITDNDMVKVESKTGEIILKAQISKTVAPGTVFIPQNYPEVAVNSLMDIHEKSTRVKLTKVG
ncbi:MAG: NADH-quinone oxidoreductase subunit NuoG [bacterium]